MLINSASVLATAIIALAALPRFVYFSIGSKRKLPPQLFSGFNLILFIASSVSFFALMALVLLFSNNLGGEGKIIAWAVACFSVLSVLLILWVIFIMNGYDPRYQFKKAVIFCPNVVLIDIVFWLTIFVTSNWWAIIPCTVFTVSSFIWNFQGYKLTKPIIDDDVVIRENDDM